MKAMVEEAVKILHSQNTPIEEVRQAPARELDVQEGALEQGLDRRASTSSTKPRSHAGATGGKILGAGGAASAAVVKPEPQARAKERLHHLVHAPFSAFHEGGSRVVVYQLNGLAS